MDVYHPEIPAEGGAVDAEADDRQGAQQGASRGMGARLRPVAARAGAALVAGLRWLRRAAPVLIAVGSVGVVSYGTWLFITAPDARDVRAAQPGQPSVVLAAGGEPLAAFRRAVQQPLALDEIPPHVVQALIATEDHRFYEHFGLDWRRSLSAVGHTLLGDPQGGSTITQQLARNLFPEDVGRARNLHRKFKEMVTALRIEHLHTKDEILAQYLNTYPFLYNAIGIEMAARTYFGKPAAALDVAEGATLVGMLKGPSYYNPVRYPERALQRRNVVLGQMLKHGMLDDAAFATLKAQPLGVHLQRQDGLDDTAPHFAAHLRKWLEAWAAPRGLDVERDGLVVQTTLDAELQRVAVQAVVRQAEMLQHIANVEWSSGRIQSAGGSAAGYAKLNQKVQAFAEFWRRQPALLEQFIRESPEFAAARRAGGSDAAALERLKADAAFMARLKLDKTRLEAGFVALDPRSGEVRAWVGSRDFEQDQFDHVAQAARQPGSTFKPFVYAAALQRGLEPQRQYLDGPVEIALGGGRVWRPTDMGGASGEMMSLRDGLVHSKNTITAQVMHEVGAPRVAELARAMGVDRSPLAAVPSLALGTSDVTLLEMVSAYATIASRGEYRKPVYVSRISDRQGRVLEQFSDSTPQRALPEPVALDLIDMMRGVVNEGTGTLVRTRFGVAADVAGKTGTTQRNTDGWFILMHPQLVAGAWVGFNDARVTMRSNYWGQGGHNAAWLVGDFFREALRGARVDAQASFPPPPVREQPSWWERLFSSLASPAGAGEPGEHAHDQLREPLHEGAGAPVDVTAPPQPGDLATTEREPARVTDGTTVREAPRSLLDHVTSVLGGGR